MANEPQQTPRDAFLRTIAVLGLIAVLLLGAWGIITLAVSLPSIFGSIGGGVGSLFGGSPAATSTSQTITVNAPKTVTSGQSMTVSWTHNNAKNGQYAYALSYSCADGVSVKAPLPTGSYQEVPCNTPFNYVNASQKMTVIPSLSKGSMTQVTFSVAATNLSNGIISAMGNATVSVAKSGSTSTTKTTSTASTKTSTSYYPAKKAAPSLWGYADLAVSINSVVPSGSRESVTFTIQNLGTNVAQAGWTFNATLPVQGSYTYQGATQQALYPGDKVVYTLSFDRPYGSAYNYNGGCTYNCGGYPYYNQYPNTNSSYTCNNYGPCNIPGYQNLYPYGSPYQYNYNGYNNGYCAPGYACSVPMNVYNNDGYANTYGAVGTVSVTADPYNSVLESNEANNTATAQAY